MRHLLRLLVFASFLVSLGAAAAQGATYIVIDADAGTVILDHNSGQPWYPASVTKLMTAYLTFDAIQSGKLTLESPVVQSKNSIREAPSKMGFRVGTVMNLDNALKMMLVKSANDIAVAVAETVGGSEANFVKMMNAEARRLGMNSTHFANPNGLPDSNHYSTARDIAVLARAIWTKFPQFREYFRIPAIKSGRHILRSQNYLLEHYHGANGMKTGFICAAGFNMVASATRVGHTLIAVVFGETSSKRRAELAAALLDKGFSTWAFGIGRKKLADVHARASTADPVNMRPQICGKKRDKNADEKPVLASASGVSSLQPRFVLMDPVPVYTGRDVRMPAPGIPLPRLRPALPGEDDARAYAPGERVSSPIDLLVPPGQTR